MTNETNTREDTEHFAFEKGKMRGGTTAPPRQNQAEKPRFSVKRQAVCLKRKAFQTENALSFRLGYAASRAM
ncbi:hypothetical protein [uncultured Desulfovibrio sp.]|uniref:hypothetical protein n=1 Tax=uncultured Desulfovibrio sp. TaxID=167968 RepID=UPI00260C060F|nr:hypothetical protein [uncultured Desulfovibrio sp.]